MPSRSGRNPPIPPNLSTRFAAFPSNPSSLPGPESSLPRLPYAHNVSNMPPMNSDLPNNLRRRGHNRSISHPFTSPFTGLGKKREKAAAKPATWDSDSDSDDVTYSVQALSTSPRKDLSKGGGSGSDKSMGNCQTCNSTVRWPGNSKVFRCTTCLMVNNLHADSTQDSNDPFDTDHDDRLRDARAPNLSLPYPMASSTHLSKSEPTLSAKGISGLIDLCLSTYFESLLDGSRSWPVQEDNRNGRLRSPKVEALPSSLARPPGSGNLSAPQDLRSRSTSASNDRERPDGMQKPSQSLHPHNLQRECKGTPIRSRAKSDLQSRPKADRRREEPVPPVQTENKDHQRHQWVFNRLEHYLISAFKGSEILNAAFPTHQPSIRSASSGNPPRMRLDPSSTSEPLLNAPVFEPDAKTLLLGDLAENSSWWMNEWAQDEGQVPPFKDKVPHKSCIVSSRNPRINWTEVSHFYHSILTAGSSWADQWATKRPSAGRSEADMIRSKRWESINMSAIEKDIVDSRVHLQRTLMKATENLLKRPRRPLRKAEDTRFLFILLANPLLLSPGSYAQINTNHASHRGDRRPSTSKDIPRPTTGEGKSSPTDAPRSTARPSGSNHHYGVLKRILGLMSNMPNDSHHYHVSWFSRLPTGQFERLIEMVGKFINYRLTRQHGHKREEITENNDELVPSFNSAAGNTPAELHAAINNRRSPNKETKKKEAPIVYAEDWQIRSAARVMALLFTANLSRASHKFKAGLGHSRDRRHVDIGGNYSGRFQGSAVPISKFYNTLLDYSDLIRDFEIWESRSPKFSFCQYPFLLSIWAKIHILEHDARRQMEVRAREAFFSSILSHRPVSQYLVLKVRRECLVEDSLRGVSEVVGSGQEEIKKGLRIEFVGEEGVDAGGLRKEWFLSLVREVFDPHHGLFIYDDDSQYCYFNPFCFESSEQFFLVGTLLGLAIYNSTILDIDLPPFAFKKLLASAPHSSSHQLTNPQRLMYNCTLEDLAEYRPALAKGLRDLLEFEGDVAETFCYDFVAQVDRYGEVISVPLCAGGENRQVDNNNRREFVELYLHYLLDTAVARQYEPFKRGFFSVCGGNALSIFRPEEIELLVRGSDEPLDVTSLRAVATYDNWSHPRPVSVPVVQWFWDFFETSPPQAQRKILSFVTGSDRIPAMGATSLNIRLACLGDDCSRYPIARTCFNTLGLYRYATREKLQKLLWDAVVNSEGFGLK